MKQIIFWTLALVIALMISMTAHAMTQDISGKVIDEKGEVMPFVSVGGVGQGNT